MANALRVHMEFEFLNYPRKVFINEKYMFCLYCVFINVWSLLEQLLLDINWKKRRLAQNDWKLGFGHNDSIKGR